MLGEANASYVFHSVFHKLSLTTLLALDGFCKIPMGIFFPLLLTEALHSLHYNKSSNYLIWIPYFVYLNPFI